MTHTSYLLTFIRCIDFVHDKVGVFLKCILLRYIIHLGYVN